MPRRFITLDEAVLAGSQTASSSSGLNVSKAQSPIAKAASLA